MKHLFSFFLLINILLINNIFAKTIKISFVKNLKPYSFLDENNKQSGFLVDYWTLWAEKSNVNISFVPSTIKNIISDIKTNKSDIYTSLFSRTDIEKSLDYLIPIDEISLNLYFKNENITNISNIKHLNKKTIAVLKNSYASKYLEINYPKIKLKKYDSFSKIKTSIYEKNIDAIFSKSLIKMNNSEKIKMFNIKIGIYAGVNKNNKKLNKIIIDGQKNISKQELSILYKKWIFNKKDETYAKKIKFDILNKKERLYLENNKDLKLAMHNGWKLMSFYNDKNEFSGFNVDLLKQINKNLKTNIKYKVFDSWTKAYDASKNNETDGIFGLSWKKEREKYFSYSTTYFFSPYYLIARINDNSIKDIKNLDNKIAILQKNSIAVKIVKENSSNAKIIYSKEQNSFFEKIQNKSVDFTIKDHAYEYDLKKYNLEIKKNFFTKEGELHIGTNKNNKIFSSIINKGLASLSENQIKKIKNKWRSKKIKKSVFTDDELEYINTSPILNVGIGNWKPILYSTKYQKMEGLAGEMLELIFNYAGFKVNIVENKWHILLKDFKNKKLDILPVTYYAKQRESFGTYSDSYFSFKDFIYVKKDNKTITSFKTLKNKKLAILKDDAKAIYVKEKFPNIKIIETLSLEDSINKLLNNEVDAIFDSQILMENKLRELLISGIKVVSQNDIKSNKIHMLLKKDDYILQSIINKSLYNIEPHKKNKIISKWLNEKKIKKSVNIVLHKGREPYVFDQVYLKGIEYDLLELALKKSNITINKANKLSLKKQHKAFKDNEFLDIVVSAKKQDDQYYYSKEFVDFQNVVVSRKKDNFLIKQIKDLKNKKIIAFEGASLYLSKEYRNIFAKKTKNYKEEMLQEKQVQDFLDKKTDLIILDVNIFKWYLKKLSNKNIKEFSFDYIFALNDSFKVAFKDENLKNLFEKNFELIKKSGEYQKIIDSYLKSDILAKMKISTLFSSLISKPIHDNDINEINKLVKIFEQLKYIDKIEVFSKELLLNFSTPIKKSNKTFIKQNSYFNILGIPKNVGFLKVYFNEKELLKASESLTLIPNLKIFKGLKSFEFIKDEYKRFKYFGNKIRFTKKELVFIKNNPILKFSLSTWKPLAIVENGFVSGIFYDYFKLLEKHSPLKFEFIESFSIKGMKEKLKSKEVDILPIPTFKSMQDFSTPSNTFARFNYVLVSNKKLEYTNNIRKLKNKIFVLPNNYTSYKIIKKNYPDVKILTSKNNKESLELISLGKADVTLIHEAVAVYYIQKFFPDLKIAGVTQYNFEHPFSIHKDNKILVSIINKILQNITEKEYAEISNKWLRYDLSTPIDYKIIYQLIFVFILILLIVFYIFRRVSKNKNKILKINKELENTILTLEKTKSDFKEQKDLFEALFKGTTDGLLLKEENKIINTNYSLLRMYNIKDEHLFNHVELSSLSPLKQTNGKSSLDVYDKYLKLCEKNSYSKFEYLAKKVTGEEFWVNIVLIKIKSNNRNLIYSIIRDISDRKFLENEIQTKALDLEYTNDELEDSNEELQTTIQNLKQTQNQLIQAEKMASLGSLVAGVAHEINTPVGIGLTGISHLEDSTKKLKEKYNNDSMSQEEFEEYLNTQEELSILIHRNLNKATSLVKSFKQVAVDQSSDEKREFYLKKYLNEILQSIHSITKKTNLKIEITCDEKLKIKSHPGAFSQIITNLIINSIIHGFSKNHKGLISINIEKIDKTLVLKYKDNGFGISDENIKKVFDPFFTTNRENGGSGLGLNIIYNIIKSTFKGDIVCESKINEGVLFIIKLSI